MTRRPALAAWLGLLGACVAEPRLSGPGESCAYTAHCAPPLVCIGNRCSAPTTSPPPVPPASDAAPHPDPGPPPRRPGFAATPSATRAPAPDGWQIVSSGAPRVAAPIVDTLVNRPASALTRTCAITEPLAVTFTYRFVRAQYAADDHGQLGATVTTGGTPSQRTCVLEALAEHSILGRLDLGRRPFRLEARFHPSQETSP